MVSKGGMNGGGVEVWKGGEGKKKVIEKGLNRV